MADSPEAWLCAELEPRLIGALTLYCGDRLLAEELAQDTLVRVLERWGEVQQLTSPAAWAHRKAVARLPRRQRTALVLRFFADLPSTRWPR